MRIGGADQHAEAPARELTPTELRALVTRAVRDGVLAAYRYLALLSIAVAAGAVVLYLIVGLIYTSGR